MAARKIILFLGSTREGRFGGKVADYVKQVLESNNNHVKIFDPVEMDFPVLKQPLHFMRDRSLAPSWLIDADKEIQEADGFVVVLSEYNCSLPPALSNMLDHFPPASFRHRPCSIVTYSMGDFGGVRAATLVQSFLSELGMIALPSRSVLPAVHTKFDADGKLTCERFPASISKLSAELAWYIDALKVKKVNEGNPN